MLRKWWSLHLSNSWCVITPDSLIEKSMLTAVVALQQCAKASHALDVSGTASQAACASVVSGNPKAWTGAAESGRAPKIVRYFISKASENSLSHLLLKKCLATQILGGKFWATKRKSWFFAGVGDFLLTVFPESHLLASGGFQCYQSSAPGESNHRKKLEAFSIDLQPT